MPSDVLSVAEDGVTLCHNVAFRLSAVSVSLQTFVAEDSLARKTGKMVNIYGAFLVCPATYKADRVLSEPR